MNKTPLHEATNKGHIAVVKELLASGADVNARDCSGKTPLHQALLNDHIEAVQILIVNGGISGLVDGWLATIRQMA